MNNKNKKSIVNHLQILSEQGISLAKRLDKKYEDSELRIDTQSWLTQVRNAYIKIFGKGSIHNIELRNVSRKVHISRAYQVEYIVGVIKGSIEDINNGFLEKLERKIEISLSDDLLIQSKEILNQGNKDIAAFLNRIVLERIIKNDAKDNGIDVSKKKTSIINDELKSNGIYTQPKWRQNQTYLDIGNHAAHGEFTEYDHQSVNRMIEYILILISNQ